MSKNHKKVCTNPSYIEHILILDSTIIGCVSISVFTSMVGNLIGIKSTATGLDICGITAAIKKYNSIMKEKKKKHDKIVLLANSKLNNIEVLISKSLIDLVISYDEFLLINNVSKEHNEMKEEIKNLKT